MVNRKPIGFWKEWSNIEDVLKPLIRKLSHVPSAGELAKRGMSSVAAAITLYHGGFHEVKRKLGYEQVRVVDGYYNNFTILRKELKAFIKYNHGKFPIWREIAQERSDLVTGINKHGGIHAVRARMGYKETMKQVGYWNNSKNILQEARKVKKKHQLKVLPNKEILAELGYSSLAAAITKNYPEKYEGIRKTLGEELSNKKPEGYWKSETIEQEIHTVMREYHLTALPTSKFLRSHDQRNLDAVISQRYPNGYAGLREKFGEPSIRKDKGYWKDIINIKREARKIIKEIGCLPGKKELETGKYNSFCSSVFKYHGGFRNLRTLLGLEQRRVDNGYWKKVKNIEREVRKFKEETEYLYLPNQAVLNNLGYGSLSAAITNHYQNGFKGYRKDHPKDIQPWKAQGKTQEMLKAEEKINEPLEKYLTRMYKNNSSATIGKKLEVAQETICGWLKHFGVEVRRGSDSMNYHVKKPTKEQLEQEYWKEENSKKDLARKYKVGYKVINRWFIEYNIVTREDKRVDISQLSENELILYGKTVYKGITVSELAKKHSAEYKYLQSSRLIELLIENNAVIRKKSKNGFWDANKTLEIAQQLYKQYGYLPTQKKLSELGYGSLTGAAAEHYGGLDSLREILGDSNGRKDSSIELLEALLEGAERK